MQRSHVLMLAGFLVAAPTAQAQRIPDIRQLGAVTARTAESFNVLPGIRALPGGGVLVNDVSGRRVVLLDSTLATVAVVADSTSATGNAYGGRVGSLIPFHGDSTLFVDPVSLSMLVIDPMGTIARVMSVPRSEDAMSLGTGTFGNPGFDGRGRLVYRPAPRIQMMAPGGPAGGAGRGNAGPMAMPSMPDSAPLVRIDLATRQLDTVTFVRTPKLNMHMTRDERGRTLVTSEINPLPTVDEWAVLADGSIAIVRGRDYRIEWINPDGSRGSTAKVPFEWQRLTDEDKVAFIDSVKVARERLQAEGAPPGAGAAGRTTAGGGPVITFQGPGGGGAMGGGGPAAPQVMFVSPDELPDYKPAFFAGAVRADSDGNLWIRTIPTKAIPGGPVYDVVNRDGELIERVQIPEGRTILGFGPANVVYLSSRGETGLALEKAQVR